MRRIRLNINQKRLFKVISDTYIYINYSKTIYTKNICSFETSKSYLMLLNMIVLAILVYLLLIFADTKDLMEKKHWSQGRKIINKQYINMLY